VRQPSRCHGHLHAQLAGGHDHQRLRLVRHHRGQFGDGRCLARRDDALQQRDAEAQRLAGAGLRLANDVVPVQGDGRVSAWIGNGSVMPTALSASTVAGSTPWSVKVGVDRRDALLGGLRCWAPARPRDGSGRAPPQSSVDTLPGVSADSADPRQRPPTR
jgi:hypothetical protein